MINLDGHSANEQFTGEIAVEELSELALLQQEERRAWLELKRAEVLCRVRNEQYEEACAALREYREEHES